MSREALESWTPGSPDLTDEDAALLDADPNVAASFDARFPPVAFPEVPLPEGLADRVVPRPPRRWPWVVGGLLAAASALFVVASTAVLTSYQQQLSMAGASSPHDDLPRPSLAVTRSPDPDCRPELTAEERQALVQLGYLAPEALDGVDAASEPDPFDLTPTVADATSTFAVDVDTGSYSHVRRLLREGRIPDPSVVRTEAFVNAQPYDYPRPPDGQPLGVSTEVVASPWADDVALLRIGLQADRASWTGRPPAHLTFLVDTSGSMRGPDRLDLVKYGLGVLVRQLRPGDTVAVVAYAGSAGVVLPPTDAGDSASILGALDRLDAGGGTAMGAGIDAAYAAAHSTYVDGDINRVVLLTDGDANVGLPPGELPDRVAREAGSGVTLTVVGVGIGNLRDDTLEGLAAKGDGHFVYLDDEREARAVFGDRLLSTLQVVARDVKVQVAFDPHVVRAWRLLGYEDRRLEDHQFRDDAVDAGEVGAGHQVTALYAVKRVGDGPLGTLRLRWEPPGREGPASEVSVPLDGPTVDLAHASADTRIAVGAATLAERLRGRTWAQRVSWPTLSALVEGAARPERADSDRRLLEMVRRTSSLARVTPP